MIRYVLTGPGPRPPFALVAQHLWGADCDFDSDGDSKMANSVDWTELTIILRPSYEQRVDIEPVEDQEPLALEIKSDDEHLAIQVAEYLVHHAGGKLIKIE